MLAHCGLTLATACSQPKLPLRPHKADGGEQMQQIDRNSGEKCGLSGDGGWGRPAGPSVPGNMHVFCIIAFRRTLNFLLTIP